MSGHRALGTASSSHYSIATSLGGGEWAVVGSPRDAGWSFVSANVDGKSLVSKRRQQLAPSPCPSPPLTDPTSSRINSTSSLLNVAASSVASSNLVSAPTTTPSSAAAMPMVQALPSASLSSPMPVSAPVVVVAPTPMKRHQSLDYSSSAPTTPTKDSHPLSSFDAPSTSTRRHRSFVDVRSQATGDWAPAPPVKPKAKPPKGPSFSPDFHSAAAKPRRNSEIEHELQVQSLYKTELCRSWTETGSCRYGSKCQFAHGVDELRPVMRHPKYKTEICRTFHTLGTCPYGTRCRFIHNRDGVIPPEWDVLPARSPSSRSNSTPGLVPPPPLPTPERMPDDLAAQVSESLDKDAAMAWIDPSVELQGIGGGNSSPPPLLGAPFSTSPPPASATSLGTGLAGVASTSMASSLVPSPMNVPPTSTAAAGLLAPTAAPIPAVAAPPTTPTSPASAKSGSTAAATPSAAAKGSVASPANNGSTSSSGGGGASKTSKSRLPIFQRLTSALSGSSKNKDRDKDKRKTLASPSSATLPLATPADDQFFPASTSGGLTATGVALTGSPPVPQAAQAAFLQQQQQQVQQQAPQGPMLAPAPLLFGGSQPTVPPARLVNVGGGGGVGFSL